MIDLQLPDEKTLPDVGGGMGDIVPWQAFMAPSDDAIRSSITHGLAQAGLNLTSFEVLRASQPAPAVVATTTDPKGTAALASQIVRSLFGQNPPFYEGYYFEVRDTKGQPVFVQSTAFRTGAGRLWISPSVADVASLKHG
jgi:hypothetical protein